MSASEGLDAGPRPMVSVIVPVWADSAALRQLLPQIPPDPRVEVIVVEAASGTSGPDWLETPVPDEPGRGNVWTVRAPRGRARQMNAGAQRARGDWLLFLHADSRLPDGWLDLVGRSTGPAVGGWFRFALDDPSWQARMLERGVALRVRLFRLPYGDQGIFVRRSVFESLGGYTDLPIMEDVDFVRRLVASGPTVELPAPLVTSARRYRHDGWLRRSTRNVALIVAYFLGVPAVQLARWAGEGQGSKFKVQGSR